MQIFLNKKALELPANSNLHQLVASQGLLDKPIAVAVNMQIVKRTLWETTPLAEQDDVTIISISRGG